MAVLMGPGGTLDMAVTALERGCESVFVGPKGWSRRPASDELYDEEIKELLDWGRPRGKDIRVAVNVMPEPEKIPAMLAKIERYAEWGAGGVMLCDPGSIALVRRLLPDIDIHVSVTAGLFNVSDIAFYEEMGANIVVIPYRWGVTELEEIRDKTRMRLEAFMFQATKRGRICPGRCYSSSYFQITHNQDDAGKDHHVGSASRGGSCYRICRAKWDLTIDQQLYPETPDLKATPELLLWELPDYVALGVDRFKIPGRERSPGLIGDICAFYRRALDHVLAGGVDVSSLAPEWDEIRTRWVRERGRRDQGRIATAAQ